MEDGHSTALGLKGSQGQTGIAKPSSQSSGKRVRFVNMVASPPTPPPHCCSQESGRRVGSWAWQTRPKLLTQKAEIIFQILISTDTRMYSPFYEGNVASCLKQLDSNPDAPSNQWCEWHRGTSLGLDTTSYKTRNCVQVSSRAPALTPVILSPCERKRCCIDPVLLFNFPLPS